jgi:type 1 fimbria pilin
MIRSSWSPRSLPLTACALLVTLYLAAPAAAQDTGVVSGTVVDATGQVVPGATVTLTNEGTADFRTLVSTERGDFAFRAVTPGSTP